MACFIAVIPHGLQENNELRRLFSKFKRTIDDKGKEVRWVQPDMWHVTIQYLGDLNASKKSELIQFLESWEPPVEWQNMELRMHGVGAFPSEFTARVLWLGLQKNQSLLDARDSLNASLKALDFIEDEKEYTPHLTLARFRNLFNAKELTQLGGRKHFGDYKVDEIMLLESVVEGHMTKYIPLFRKQIV
ncbi:MAG: RNA 2',3'-cyclic phosphodiesterase [Bdellovibrionaceae bacterium]|nr:RNA 2',3'-cyclic phosphodiesterase [Pseudobdellovibrionaceae bacterium]